jgi:hypothetical protein
MDIQGTTVMVLGGGGMVGRAVCRELLKNRPARIVVCSLHEEESKLAIQTLQEELERAEKLTHNHPTVELVPEWGNLFARDSLRHLTGNQAMQTPEGRAAIIEDTLTPMSATVARRFYLYQLVLQYRPQVIIDAMNTATGIAYSDIFSHARQVWREVQDESTNKDSVEKLLCSLYIPQLIRHVDVLYRAMVAVDTKAYVKLGTSGTGGMGWNIPYTHGEERPSSVLLSKSAVAGAHTLLLFLLARTPGIASLENEDEVVSKAPPATMEIKPTAMIGWRGIGHGPIHKRGRPVELEEVDLKTAIPATGTLKLDDPALGETQRPPARDGLCRHRRERPLLHRGVRGHHQSGSNGIRHPRGDCAQRGRRSARRQHRQGRHQRPQRHLHGTHLPGRLPDASAPFRSCANWRAATASIRWPSRTWGRRVCPSCSTKRIT